MPPCAVRPVIDNVCVIDSELFSAGPARWVCSRRHRGATERGTRPGGNCRHSLPVVTVRGGTYEISFCPRPIANLRQIEIDGAFSAASVRRLVAILCSRFGLNVVKRRFQPSVAAESYRCSDRAGRRLQEVDNPSVGARVFSRAAARAVSRSAGNEAGYSANVDCIERPAPVDVLGICATLSARWRTAVHFWFYPAAGLHTGLCASRSPPLSIFVTGD